MDEFTPHHLSPGRTLKIRSRPSVERDENIGPIVRRFLTGFMLVLAIAAAAWPALPRRFEAAGSVILRPTDREGQSDSALAMRQPLDDNAVQSEMDLVAATPVVDAVIARHALTADPEFTAPPTLSRLLQRVGWTFRTTEPTEADLRARVRAHLLIARDRRSYTVRIGVWSADPEKAKALAQTVLDAYLGDQLARKRRAAEQLFQWLDLRAGLIRAKQEASAHAVEDFMARSGLVDRGDQVSLDAQLVTLSQEAALARARSIELANKAETLSGLRAINALDAAPEVIASTTIQALKQSLSAALGRTVVMSPEQRAITDQIAAEANRIVRSVTAEADTWRRREAALQGQIRAIRASLTDRQKASMTLERLQQDASNDRSALTEALARLKGQTANDGAQRADVEVVSQPETPRSAAFPSPVLFGLGALLAGCLAGAAMNVRPLLRQARLFLEI